MEIREGLSKIGFGNGEFFGVETEEIGEIAEKTEKYVSSLIEFNRKFDLVNADTFDEIIVRHVLDSLSAVPAICREISERKFSPELISAADIGSGAGFPGIPLSIALPKIHFTLVERMTKRCAFLENCKSLLNLSNVSVEENQAERLEQRRFDLCAFRAFRPLDRKMAKVLLRILKDGGFLAAYKARLEKITEEMAALPSPPAHKVIPLFVPGLDDHERNLVVIEKK